MMLILVAVLNVKDLFAFVKVGNGKMMSKLRDKDYFWMLTMRKKLTKVKVMENPCMLDTLSLSWTELGDNFSVGTSLCFSILIIVHLDFYVLRLLLRNR